MEDAFGLVCEGYGSILCLFGPGSCVFAAGLRARVQPLAPSSA